MKDNRLLFSLLFVLSIEANAQDRTIEMRADRTIIYPQKMELQGEETLGDILTMYPDIMQEGFEDMLSGYNVRIDNVPINGDNRIICRQLKAKTISAIQICDNTGVAKGTTGLNRVIDIILAKNEEGTHGHTGIEAGTDNLTDHHAMVRHKAPKTDVIALSSYSYQDIDNRISHDQRLFAHMTNQLSAKDRLLTYVTQQYTNTRAYPTSGKEKAQNEKCLTRARYFHKFNDKGTELLLVGSYQYGKTSHTAAPTYGENATGTENSSTLYIAELNTPLLKGLSMMAGAEGDFSYSSYRTSSAPRPTYMTSNNDLYLQLNYVTGPWRFTLGDRTMFYHYSAEDFSHNDIRSNIEASAIASLTSHSQAQAAYHRKFINAPFAPTTHITQEQWASIKPTLSADYIDEAKIAYTFTQRSRNISVAAYYQMIERSDNIMRLSASAYGKKGALAMTAGANLCITEGSGHDFATFHLSPRVTLPHQMRLNIQSIFSAGDLSLMRDEDVYLSGQLTKQFGAHWHAAIEWHDIFSHHYSACMATIQYAF